MDPQLARPGSFGGIRIISDRLGKILRDELVVLGTDDGAAFWVEEGGHFIDKEAGKFRAGPFAGVYSKGVVTLETGTTWTKMKPASNVHAMPRASL
mmetsp:Transcript_23917/g.66376  ORF Transcript_23917/g.66376 Transcript_23917/m.66376 type:complete len:96 (+) Transcript_23917:807-1094(+)